MTDFDEQLAKAQQRAMEKAAQVMKLQAQRRELARKEDQRRKIILGSAVIQLMRADPSLVTRVRAALDAHFASSVSDTELFAKVDFWSRMVSKSAEPPSAEDGRPMRGRQRATAQEPKTPSHGENANGMAVAPPPSSAGAP